MLNTTDKEDRGLPRNPSLSVGTIKDLKDDAGQVINAPVDCLLVVCRGWGVKRVQAWASHRQVKDDSIVAEECLETLNVFAKNMPLFAMRDWLQSAHRTL